MFEGQDAFVVCYDVGDEESLSIATKICVKVHQAVGKSRPMLLVGLKCDTVERTVDYTEAERTAEVLDSPYIECSARESINVEAVFDVLLLQFFRQEKAVRDAKVALKMSIIA
jgi:GTPase SAR1 family protein